MTVAENLPNTAPQEDATAARHAGAARLVNCGTCGQRPGRPCTAAGDHLARYLRAGRRGLLSRGDLAAVVAGLEVIAAHVIVPGAPSGPRPEIERMAWSAACAEAEAAYAGAMPGGAR